MGWADSGINWLNPGPNVPIWTCLIELSKCINERHHLTGRQRFDIKQFPLIAYDESDNNPSSTISRGTRQYKMFQHLNRPFIGFKAMEKTHAIQGIFEALRNELMWDYSRTDISDYTVDENTPRPRDELNNHGFPQSWEQTAESTGMDDIEYVESLYPACNNIWTRLDQRDSSLYDTAGFPKREIITELFELMKAFKYVNFDNFSDFNGDLRNTVTKRELFNTDPAVFNSSWASTPDEISNFGGNKMQVFKQESDKMLAVCHNTEEIIDLSQYGLNPAPDFVTPPRIFLAGLNDGPPPESTGEGYYDLAFTQSNGIITMDRFITPNGTTPNSLTIPPNVGDNFRIEERSVTTGGVSNGSKNGWVFDLETVTGQMDYPVDGS